MKILEQETDWEAAKTRRSPNSPLRWYQVVATIVLVLASGILCKVYFYGIDSVFQQKGAEEHQGTPPPNSTIKSADSYRKGKLRNYTFEVPIDWEVGGRAQEQHMHGMLDVVPSLKITALSTFASGDGCVVTVYEIPLPAGEGDAYIDKLHSQNEEKFRIERSRELVKNVLENRKIRRAIFDVLLLDWESNRGQLPRERQWVLHTKELPNNIVIVTASCNEQGYRATKDAIDRVASSVTLNVAEEAGE